jgi:hypothetical protein
MESQQKFLKSHVKSRKILSYPSFRYYTNAHSFPLTPNPNFTPKIGFFSNILDEILNYFFVIFLELN